MKIRDFNVLKGFKGEVSLKTKTIKSKKLYCRKNRKKLIID